MFSLLLAAASLTPAFNDASYADLGYANRIAGECIARFGTGSIEIRQAFNEADRTMINVAVVTGKPTRAVPVGTKLWAKSSYGPAWRAVVIESSPQRLRFAAHNRFVGDLFAEDSLTIALHERLDASRAGDAVLVDVGPDISGFRGKLASAFDCADGLGI